MAGSIRSSNHESDSCLESIIPIETDHSDHHTNSSATTSVKRKTRIRSYIWFYSLDVSITSNYLVSSRVDPSNFLDVLHSAYCQQIKTARLHATEDTSIISFSLNTDAASVFHVGNVPVTQITGFISTVQQMDKSAVLAWLRHPNIYNLELTAIASRHKVKRSVLSCWRVRLQITPPTGSGSASICARPVPKRRPQNCVREAARRSRTPRASGSRPLPPPSPPLRRRPPPPRRLSRWLSAHRCALG